MDIFKEKEESEAVKITLDPEGGLVIENVNLDFDKEIVKSPKAKSYADSHKNTEATKSELKALDTFKASEMDTDELDLGEHAKEYQEVLVSLDELLEFLDNNEEQIDV